MNALVRPRARVKRCTCYSYKDKECVYYCHLDVIWMNTPERIVPYGLTNVQRHKRSDKEETSGSPTAPRARCICTEETDWQCNQFCRQNESLLDKTVWSSGQKVTFRVPTETPRRYPLPVARPTRYYGIHNDAEQNSGQKHIPL
ncbi:endothelin-3b [Chiloscyllium plagiosum]|uniref:endothelin-3b n=1 Tax=Chiloscyllium plagiosum TaxID=36176 RepID=UPI001CB802DA|nr:endothelin-3b [Chiloscyllium plagiosum]